MYSRPSSKRIAIISRFLQKKIPKDPNYTASNTKLKLDGSNFHRNGKLTIFIELQKKKKKKKKKKKLFLFY